jgi:hypothetical protein
MMRSAVTRVLTLVWFAIEPACGSSGAFASALSSSLHAIE